MNTLINQPAKQYNMAPLRASLTRAVASINDHLLVEQLREGNEAAFMSLIECYHTAMLRLAMVYVTSQAVAEEVVQETWVGILEGLDRFEERSSLKTWMFRILINCAITRSQRERRSIPFSLLLADYENDSSEPAVDADHFLSADHQRAGQWESCPSNWLKMPEECLLSQEMRVYLEKAIEALPTHQREIIILRDIEGWTSEDTCNFLGISDVNQRVLLHRARSKVRVMLEQYFKEE